MNDDGTMARVPDLVEFCKLHNLKMVTVAELIRYRLRHERSVRRVAETVLSTKHGEFQMIAYESETDPTESHVALVLGDVASPDKPVLVRVHSHNLVEDVFGAMLPDCSHSVEYALQRIAEAGAGALVYLHNGSRGFGIDSTVSPSRIVTQREPNTMPGGDPYAERHQRTLRQTGLGGQILSDLGIHKIRLLTNRPTHAPALQGFGVEIVEQIPLRPSVAQR